MVNKKRSQKRLKKAQDILEIFSPIIQDEDFLKMKKIRHHIFFNRYEHSLNVAKMCHSMAKFFGADVKTCTLAWLLHDYHHTFIKDSRHAVLAAKNSERFEVNCSVLNIIKCHMYPLGRKMIQRVQWKNFWIVKFADSIAPLIEIGYSVLSLKLRYDDIIKFKTNQLLLELLSTPEQDVLSHWQA